MEIQKMNQTVPKVPANRFDKFRTFAVKTALFFSIPVLVGSCSNIREKKISLKGGDVERALNGAVEIYVYGFSNDRLMYTEDVALITITNRSKADRSHPVARGSEIKEIANGDTVWLECTKVDFNRGVVEFVKKETDVNPD